MSQASLPAVYWVMHGCLGLRYVPPASTDCPALGLLCGFITFSIPPPQDQDGLCLAGYGRQAAPKRCLSWSRELDPRAHGPVGAPGRLPCDVAGQRPMAQTPAEGITKQGPGYVRSLCCTARHMPLRVKPWGMDPALQLIGREPPLICNLARYSITS